ncbi:MAG: hypothetical protein ISR76_04940 [Planctomycetes bacterium]|nr:hypothetical protein [Planctomycetota bacterium]MBL7008322.1 hypothetical protein [Planctomycetota bacterium]
MPLFLTSQLSGTNNLIAGGGAFFMLIAWLVLIVGVVVHLAFAAAVFGDASELRDRRTTGCDPVFGTPFVWCLATILGGVFVATAYWLVHRSALSRGGLETPPLDH